MTLSYKFDNDSYDGQKRCCGRDRECDDYLVLAIATVPMQQWRLTYSPEKALGAGTMFAELNLPFKGGKCR